MSEELKPCPFCGGDAKLTLSASGRYHTECGTDGCHAHLYAYSETKAIVAWNRRPAPPAAKAVEMDAQRLNVLASFAHGIRMGAIKPKDLPKKAREALERTGLLSLDDVVALIDGGKHG